MTGTNHLRVAITRAGHIMPAQAPPYYALKRTILMVICAVCIAILSYKSLSIIVWYVQDEDPPNRPPDRFQIGLLFFAYELVGFLYLILIASCGLFGAWCHNLIMTYIFAIILLLATLGWIKPADFSDDWLVVCFTGALLVLVIFFLIDLHKMKRTHKFLSVPTNV